MNIIRTYPQPDSPKPNIGPRERAMAVFKYLLDLEPGEALKHPRFAVIQHAFEQSEQVGVNRNKRSEGEPETFIDALDPSLCAELTGTTQVDAVVQRYGQQAESKAPDGI